MARALQGYTQLSSASQPVAPTPELVLSRATTKPSPAPGKVGFSPTQVSVKPNRLRAPKTARYVWLASPCYQNRLAPVDPQLAGVRKHARPARKGTRLGIKTKLRSASPTTTRPNYRPNRTNACNSRTCCLFPLAYLTPKGNKPTSLSFSRAQSLARPCSRGRPGTVLAEPPCSPQKTKTPEEKQRKRLYDVRLSAQEARPGSQDDVQQNARGSGHAVEEQAGGHGQLGEAVCVSVRWGGGGGGTRRKNSKEKCGGDEHAENGGGGLAISNGFPWCFSPDAFACIQGKMTKHTHTQLAES